MDFSNQCRSHSLLAMKLEQVMMLELEQEISENF